ncbi:hypothetical protein M3652_20620, partial [Bacillus intestinalis]|nr:hypothetical protein [Bacillus spizizenii]
SNRGPAECRSSAVFSVFPTVPCLEARIYRAACMRRRARPIVTSVDVRILAARDAPPGLAPAASDDAPDGSATGER